MKQKRLRLTEAFFMLLNFPGYYPTRCTISSDRIKTLSLRPGFVYLQ